MFYLDLNPSTQVIRVTCGNWIHSGGVLYTLGGKKKHNMHTHTHCQHKPLWTEDSGKKWGIFINSKKPTKKWNCCHPKIVNHYYLSCFLLCRFIDSFSTNFPGMFSSPREHLVKVNVPVTNSSAGVKSVSFLLVPKDRMFFQTVPCIFSACRCRQSQIRLSSRSVTQSYLHSYPDRSSGSHVPSVIHQSTPLLHGRWVGRSGEDGDIRGFCLLVYVEFFFLIPVLTNLL